MRRGRGGPLFETRNFERMPAKHKKQNRKQTEQNKRNSKYYTRIKLLSISARYRLIDRYHQSSNPGLFDSDKTLNLDLSKEPKNVTSYEASLLVFTTHIYSAS